MTMPTTSPLRRLFTWRPLLALWVLMALAMAVPAARMLVDAGHFAPGGLRVETEGASGTLTDGRLDLDLPVDVYNGSDRVVMDLSLWVRAYACPQEDSPLHNCARVLSTQQDIPMRLMPGGSLHAGRTLSSTVPADLPGHSVRVLRQIDSVSDDHDEMDRLRETRVDNDHPDPNAP